MRSKKRIVVAACAALVLALGYAVARLAADPGAWSLEPQGVPILQTYEGPGTVALLDNGDAVIFLGAESEPFDTMILAPEDSSDFSLVEENAEAFIRPGRRPGSSGTVIPFVETTEDTPMALKVWTGRLKVAVSNGETIAVEIRDANGATFSHEWVLRETGSPMFTHLVPAGAKPPGGDSVTRAGGDEDQPQTNTVTCAATCDNGTGTTTCPGKMGCYAYCGTDGTPHVGCGKRATVDP